MAEILPAILPKDVEDLRDKFAAVPDEIRTVHLDVLEEDICGDYPRPFEAHLMVSDPEAIMDRWVNRGAKAIIVHKLPPAILEYKNKVQLGLGVELDKPLEEVWPLVESVDFVHLMSIAEMGEQGHAFETRVFDRIRAVREKFPFKTISVDGGIDASNYERLIELGADKLVVGSHFQEIWEKYGHH